MKKIKSISIIVSVLLVFGACSFDKKDWRSSKQLDSIPVYQDFIKNHPKSKFVDSAKIYIRSIKENLINNENIFITSISKFDEYDRIDNIVLFNTKGEKIVTLVLGYNNYNLMQIVKADMIDESNNKKIHTTTYDVYERPENEKFLCLDFNGNIIRRDGNAVLVNKFNVNQKSVSEIDRKSRTKTTKTYPCLDCSDILNISECFFVL